MSRGKYLSLEEAIKSKKLDRFAKEHPSTGDRKRFDALFDAIAHGKKPGKEGRIKMKPTGGRTSGGESGED